MPAVWSLRRSGIESWAANLPSPSAYLKASILRNVFPGRIQILERAGRVLVAANVDGDSERDMA